MMAAFALAACGDSDDSAQSLSFELGGDGKAAKFSGPESAESGEAEITFTNETKDEAEMQLIRVDGDHRAEDVVKGLEAATQGKPFPEWFFAGGGVGTTTGRVADRDPGPRAGHLLHHQRRTPGRRIRSRWSP